MFDVNKYINVFYNEKYTVQWTNKWLSIIRLSHEPESDSGLSCTV